MLLERGANVDAQNLGGMTPLWGAAQDGHLEVARLLLGHNADVNAADSEGRTPLWVAQIKNHDDMAELLVSAGGTDPRTSWDLPSVW
mmetsp:Transcript_1899/g.5555  ORF Transcript_1899/g.5555 Transcript_1899/m.5555 type:complete len:87 (-) Transcript_1899:144-404(-)